MIRRTWAGFAGGFLVTFAIYMSVEALFTEYLFWSFLITWPILGALIARSDYPWPSAWSYLGAAILVLSVVLFVGTPMIEVTNTDESVTNRAAFALGSFIGKLIVVSMVFLLGVLFILLGRFRRRKSQEKKPSLEKMSS